MRCAQRAASGIGITTLALCVCLLAGAAAAQTQGSDEYPRDSQGYYVAPDLSDVPFSLPEGTDSPEYREPLKGNRRQQGPSIKSFYGEGFASDAVISSYVGNISIAMENCDTSHSTSDHRVVRVDLERDNYAFRKVVDGILLRAAEFAWHHCPRTYWLANVWNNLDYLYNVHEVDVYLPNGNLAIRAKLETWYGGDGSMWSGAEYSWGTVEDLEGRRRQEAAQLAQAQAEQERQQALAAQRAALERQRAAEEAAASTAAAATAGKVFRVILLLLAAGFLFWMREPIARWYYFAFHPHPAAPAIRSALTSGTVLDGRRLATILGEAPADGRILRAVRAEQAQALIVEMQSMTQARIRELEARAREQYEHAAAQQLQAALAQAAVVHEQAKAMLNATQGASR